MTHAAVDLAPLEALANARPLAAKNVVAPVTADSAAPSCAPVCERSCSGSRAELCARDPTTPWLAFAATSGECRLLLDGADGNSTTVAG